MKNIFEGYQFPILEDKASKYHNIRIEISGVYGWGVGYYSESLYRAFHNDVYDSLKSAGYDIKYSDFSGSCDYLVKDGSAIKLYMHPMEFTGAATLAESKEIAKILDSCECIKDAELTKSEPLYDISDTEYRNMIYADAENIALCMLESGVKLKNLYDAGFDFAQAAGIDRLCDPNKGGLSSGDVDVSAVDDIRKECLEIIGDKVRYNASDVAKAVGQKAQEWIAFIDTVEKQAPEEVYNEIHKYENDKHMSNYVIHLRLNDYKRIAEEKGIAFPENTPVKSKKDIER